MKRSDKRKKNSNTFTVPFDKGIKIKSINISTDKSLHISIERQVAQALRYHKTGNIK